MYVAKTTINLIKTLNFILRFKKYIEKFLESVMVKKEAED